MPNAPTSPLQPVAGSVFHYTSAAGLLGILEQGELWASEATSLNDLSEIRQGWDFVRKWLKGRSDADARDLRANIRRLPSQFYEPFVLSASLLPDDAAQWRLYADEARGYAVEIDASVKLAAVGSGNRPASTGSLDLGTLFRDGVTVSPWYRCLYADAVKVQALELVLERYRQAQEHIATDAESEEEASWRGTEARDEALSYLTVVAGLIKSPGFSGEEEARVIASPLIRTTFQHYRATEVGIVSYVKLRTSHNQGRDRERVYPEAQAERHALPIRSVRYGARLKPECERSLIGLLGSAGNDQANVWRSKVPLR